MEDVKRLEVVRLEPRDVIVIHVDHEITQAYGDNLKSEMEKRFPGQQVVVFGPGFRMQVFRPAA